MRDRDKNYLAIDLGKKNSGLAFWDAAAQVAIALRVVDSSSTRDFIDLLCQQAQQRDAVFVLGLPLHSDGTEHRWTRSVRAFARTLQKACGREVLLQDETLSSVEAAGLARQQGRKSNERLDDLAFNICDNLSCQNPGQNHAPCH